MLPSALDFSITFQLNNTPNDIKFVDLTDYTGAGILTTQVKGNFELTSIVGIFHSNTVWGAGSDIVRNVSDTFVHNAPLDINAVVLNGLYSFKYTIHVTNEPFSFALIGVDLPNKKYIVSGNCLTNVLNATGGNVIITCPSYGGTYAIDPLNCSYDSVNDKTYVAITVAIPSPVFNPGTLAFVANTIYTLTKTTNYCFVEPSVTLDVQSDCATGILTSTDVSTYIANDCGATLSPSLITRVHRITYPIDPATGLVVHAVVTGSTAALTIQSPDLWTGTYQATIITTLLYILSDGTVVSVIVTGSTTHIVQCEEGLCCAYQCIKNIVNNYHTTMGSQVGTSVTGQVANKFNLLISVLSYWLLYSIAKNCGDVAEQDIQLANIIALAKASDCDCCSEPSNAPVQVIPIITGSGVGSTSVVTTCSNGITVTATTVGTVTTYQVCLDWMVINAGITSLITAQNLFDHVDTVQLGLVNKQVVMYNSGTGMWNNVLLGMTHISDIDLITNPPVNTYALTWNGSTGKAEFLPAKFHNVLNNDIGNAGIIANLLEQTLKTYTLPAGELATNEDFIEIDALFTLSYPANILYNFILKLYFGSAVFSTTINNIKILKLKINAKINRTGAATQFVEINTFRGTFPVSILGNVITTATETLAAPIIIKVTGQNLTAPATANLIVLNYMKILKNNK